MAEDSGEKTEQATEKRMKEVVEKGQLSRSQDMTAWLGVGAAALMLPTTIARGAQSGTEQVLAIGTVAANPNPELAVRILSDALGSVLTTLGPLLGMVALAVLVGSPGRSRPWSHRRDERIHRRGLSEGGAAGQHQWRSQQRVFFRRSFGGIDCGSCEDP